MKTGRLASLCIVVLLVACTSGIAQATLSYNANFEYNGLAFAPDGTSNPPVNGIWGEGNTITLAGAGSLSLQTVVLTGYAGGNQTAPVKIDLYAGSNPNTGAFLGSETTVAGFGYTTDTFNFNGLALPGNTLTFIVSLPDNDGSYDRSYSDWQQFTSASGPTVGSGVNSLWYGLTPGSFVADNSYAIRDGATTNFLAAAFYTTATGSDNTATTPEPGLYAVLLLGMIGLLVARRRRKIA